VTCPTCTELRRKIRTLQQQMKKLRAKAETPGEKRERIAKLRASLAKGRARKKAAPASTPPAPTE
jgi:hypothetical protein